MKREFSYRLVLAYDGTNYAGWQIQPKQDTIQARLEAALAALFGQTIALNGAGRTDAGVHARGQVASFRAAKSIDATTLLRALNANLPEDIRVLKVASVGSDFHARFAAISKEYRYQIVNAAVMDPFLRRYALHHPRNLDLAAMRRVAHILVGKHDFIALSAKRQHDASTTMRTISRIDVARNADFLIIAVRADGFLYKMVRSIAGALLRVGREESSVEDIKAYLLEGSRTSLVQTAPAHGLFLWKVWY